MPITSLTDEQYRRIMGINVDGVVYGTRAVIPGMVERGFVRILTVHNPLSFTFDGVDQRGFAAELAALEEQSALDDRRAAHLREQESVATAMRLADEALAPTGLNASSAMLLSLVVERPGLAPSEAAELLHLAPSSVTRFADELVKRLELDVHFYSARISAARQEALYGKLWEQGEDGVERYLQINKVEPMQRALDDLEAVAWMAGLRSEQTAHRAGLRGHPRQRHCC